MKAEELDRAFRNIAFKGHDLSLQDDVVDLESAIELAEQYAKEKAVEFVQWCDSVDPLTLRAPMWEIDDNELYDQFKQQE